MRPEPWTPRPKVILRASSRFSTNIRWRYPTVSEIIGGDTFFNVLENPSVGIVFVVPKRREVVRVSGMALLARDPDLLEGMAVGGKLPDLAMIVRVREAFFHCGKSMIRSGMWEPDRWGSIDGLPTYAQALKDHGAMADSLEDLQARVERNEEKLY